MSKIQWQSADVKPDFIGMCALRIQTEFTDADKILHVAHEILIGNALEGKFAFNPGHDWFCLDRYFITHYLELPPIDGTDKYFRAKGEPQ
jgi:hypothetical protein